MDSFLNLAEMVLSANDVEQTSVVIDDKKGWNLRAAFTLSISCQLLSPFWAWAWSLLFKYQLLKYPPLIVSLPCDRQKWSCEKCEGT